MSRLGNSAPRDRIQAATLSLPELFAVCFKRSVRLTAFALVLAASHAAAEGPRVLPVLSQESGRVEALLLLDAQPMLPADRALDRVLPGSALQRPLGGLRVQLGDGSRIGTDLTFDAQPGLALLCRGNIGLAAALGSLAEHCLLADVGAVDPLLGAAVGQGANLSGFWRSAGDSVDLRFGLSWLDADSTGPGHSITQPLAGTAVEPWLAAAVLPGPLVAIQSQQLSLGVTGRLGEHGWLQLDGASSRSSAAGLLIGSPLRWDSTSLSVGGGYGAFSGTLTGRLIEVPSEAQSSFDIDLGLSWRTPWRAQFTVGARNLLGQPDASQWPLTTLPRSTDGDSRTPYVRYHQDL